MFVVTACRAALLITSKLFHSVPLSVVNNLTTRRHQHQPRSIIHHFTTAYPHSYRSLLLLCCWCCFPQGIRSFYSKMSHTTERSGGVITVSPTNEAEQSALVVISHGLGDTAEGFADAAEMMAQQMPYAKFVLPTAPTKPVTMNMGMPMPSWYDIVGLDERSNEKCDGIEESRQTLTKILESEHENNGLPYHRMLLAGFSQGGALSLFTGMQLERPDQKLGGVVLMSGYLPSASKFTITPGFESVPILHCHGTQDMLVASSMADKSKAVVEEKGATDYTYRKYPIGHTVSMDELRDVLNFIKEKLPPDETCKIKLKDPSKMSVKELKAVIRKSGLQSKAIGLMEKSEFIKLVADYREGKL